MLCHGRSNQHLVLYSILLLTDISSMFQYSMPSSSHSLHFQVPSDFRSQNKHVTFAISSKYAHQLAVIQS